MPPGLAVTCRHATSRQCPFAVTSRAKLRPLTIFVSLCCRGPSRLPDNYYIVADSARTHLVFDNLEQFILHTTYLAMCHD